MSVGAEAGLLRVATAGSVDDGKSTLIGRLLWDAKAILEDQVAAVTHASEARGHNGVNLAMLTDGLRAERDQGITIDVAYRYFATPRRRFVLTDTPGHFEYTRNMVTGASNADLAVILVDARNGVLEQTRRHAVIASMLHLPHVVVAVNKMDLVDWEESVFTRICEDLTAFVNRFDEPSLTFIPMSAVLGDNVVEPSDHMPWYSGPPLLRYLEEVPLADPAHDLGARLPVQWVVAPTPAAAANGNGNGAAGRPGLAGQLVAGVLRTGDEVVVLPGGATSTVASIDALSGPVEKATAGEAVTIRLAEPAVVERGDMVCATGDRPEVGDDLEALVCWMGDAPLAVGASYRLKQTSRWCTAEVDELHYRLDIETLEHDATAVALGPNDIGSVSLRLSTALVFDPYRANRNTGSFILVDEDSNVTVAAGMIVSRHTPEATSRLARPVPTAG